MNARDSRFTARVLAAVRRIPPESVDPTVKNFHWGDLMRGLYDAYERGGETVVLSDGQGNVTEGPGFNVFAVVDGRVATPARGVLEGITRRSVLETARRLGVAAAVSEGELVAGDVVVEFDAGGQQYDLLEAEADLEEARQQLIKAEAEALEILKAAGFQTIGLYRNGWVAPTFGFDQGFDHYEGPPPGQSWRGDRLAAAA